VYAAASLGAPETYATLAALQADVAVVSCFSRRIPLGLAALPRLGTLNLHPSLLPAYRGPAPLFWALRDGLHTTGVTVHLLDAGLDSGPIVAQQPVALPDGASGAELERVCGEHGGALLLAAMDVLAHGTATPRPQPIAGDYRPWPTPDDFRIEPMWSARHAFNFIRGTAEWGQPYPVAVGGESFMLAQALGYDLAATLSTPFERDGRVLRVQCAPGVLVVYLA
jgi:methionyl-tRNA formyltransferase